MKTSGSLLKKFFLLFIIPVVLFCSCRNFMSGSDLLKEIEDQIEKSQSPAVYVTIAQETEGITLISVENSKSMKKKDTLTLVFELDSEHYDFVVWKALKAEDKKTDLTGKIKATVTKSKNVYTSEIELLEATDNLILVPEVYAFPAVKTTSPAYSATGVSCFSPIIVTFTQPMKDGQWTDSANFSLTTSNLLDVSKCYENPVLSEDGKTLTIVPDSAEMNKFIIENPTVDIVVTLSDKLVPLIAKETFTAFTYSFRIYKEVDVTKPVINTINITKKINEFETATENSKTVITSVEKTKNLSSLKNKVFCDWTDADYELSLVNDKIHISLAGTEKGSGIKHLVITETLETDDAGTEPANKTSVSSEIRNFQINGESYSADFDYELQTNLQGLIKVEFVTQDYYGLESEPVVYYLIKNILDLSDNRSAGAFDIKKPDENKINFPDANGEYSPYSSNSDSDDDNKFDIICNTSFYKDKVTNFKATVYYWNEGEEKKEAGQYLLKERIKENYHNITEITPMTFNPDKIGHILVKVENAFGNTFEKQYELPEACVIRTENLNDKNADDVINAIRSCIEGSPKVLCKKEDDDYSFINDSESLSFPGSYTFYAIPEHNEFYGCAKYPLTIEFNEERKVVVSDYYDIEYPEYNVSCVPGPEYSGIHNVTLTCTKESTNENLTFYPFYKSGWDRTFVENSFTVKSCEIYELWVAAFDQTGMNVGEKYTGETIDASYNNAPLPYTHFIVGYNISYNSLNGLNFLYGDERTLAANKEYSLSCRLFPSLTYESSYDATLEVTEEMLQSNPATEINFKTDSSGNYNRVFPFEAPEKGNYYLYYVLEEKDGKKLIETTTFSSLIETAENRKYDISTLKVAVNDKGKNQLSIDTPINIDGYSVWMLGSDNNWYEDGVPDDWAYKHNNYIWKEEQQKYISIQLDDSDNPKKIANDSKTFIKINSFDRLQRTPQFLNSIYVYPSYFLENRTMRLKNIISGKMGEQIVIDQPTLIRTVYSKTNWGEDSDLWATRGVESDTRVEDSTITYAPVTKGIPSKAYYCVVVNFPDGTSGMGEIKQMP